MKLELCIRPDLFLNFNELEPLFVNYTHILYTSRANKLGQYYQKVLNI